MAQASNTAEAVIGHGFTRIDGPKKVTGMARYTSDHAFPGLVYAVPVTATITTGRVTALDPQAALQMPGVIQVFHPGNFGDQVYRKKSGGGKTDETRPPLADERITYYGQYVALVVANTYEQAVAGAAAVKVSYAADKANVDMRLSA
jgi:xanthine dehydrogenase YagR molybdenum-binding subunit